MTFAEVLPALAADRKVRRKGWKLAFGERITGGIKVEANIADALAGDWEIDGLHAACGATHCKELLSPRGGMDCPQRDDGPPSFTPERFCEVFQAAIGVGCAGRPPTWTATSPLLSEAAFGVEAKGTGATLSEAIGHLVTLATKQAKEKLEAARSALAHAEERWRRIEAAANEMTADGKR
jgi:hypothetical protein